MGVVFDSIRPSGVVQIILLVQNAQLLLHCWRCLKYGLRCLYDQPWRGCALDKEWPRQPDLALDFHWADFCDSGWGKIYLGEPTGNWNQRWEINGKELICKGSNEEPIDDLRMDVFENGTEDGTKVGVYRQNGQSNQHWNLLGHYFHILGAESGKVLDTSMTNIGEVVMWEMNGQDNQLWFWDPEYREVLRNKQFPDMALDFHWADYCESDPNWGKVYLNEFTDLPNQKFEQYGSEIICKGSNEEHIPDLRLDVFQNGTDDGAKVGVYLKNDSPNQMWTLHDIK